MKGSVKLKICCFSVLLLMIAMICITQLTNSELHKNILFVLAVILVIIVDAYLLKRTINGKGFLSKKINVVIVVMLLIIFAMLFSVLFGQENPDIQGNNINASYYQNAIGSKGEYSIDQIIKEKEEAVGMNELFQVQSEQYITIFYYNSNQIIAFDIYEEAEKYYYAGQRMLIYSSDVVSEKYTDEETIKEDIVQSRIRTKVLTTDNLSAWGVVRNISSGELKINGKKVDFIKRIEGQNNKEYYFWYVKNVGEIENIESIPVSFDK